VVVKDTTMVGGQGNSIFGFEGSQAVPVSPSGGVRLVFRINLKCLILIQLDGLKCNPLLGGLH
jgi:hypothetical protein